MENEMGVYALRSLSTGKSYVGLTARSFTERQATHFAKLRHGKHHIKELQRDWNTYGETDFIFEILESVGDKNMLPIRERHWIDRYGPEQLYNNIGVRPRDGRSGRKANKATDTVIYGTLYTSDENTTGIRLSDPAWSAWLEDAQAFYYQHEPGGFSARKQAHRRGYFWYAYKRIDGKLYKRYLGERRNITAGKLAEMAAKFSEIATQRGRA